MEAPDLKQLRYFLALAEELNFTRAAERLGIQQPPLTIQIHKLERSLGCQLLIRGRKTQLTAAGAKLADEVRRLLDQADRAILSTQRIAHGESGELRVGVPPSVMLTGLPTAIRKYRQRYPEVAFTLREMGTSSIEQALRNREIDLGFLRESHPAAPLHSELFLTEDVLAVLPSSHPLATTPSLKLRQLRKEAFVFFPRRVGPDFCDALMADCGAAGFAPNIVQEATQWQSVISFVEAGMGVSVAPACVEKFRWPGVVYRKLPSVSTKVYASWTDDHSAAVRSFLTMATRAAAPGRVRG
ncbi:MAG: LysR substrate-binding domain-containing protein [Acidobacteriota bacterium]